MSNLIYSKLFCVLCLIKFDCVLFPIFVYFPSCRFFSYYYDE